MAKFYGKIGFAESNVESPAGSGVYKDVIVERTAYGDIVDDVRRTQEADKLNYDLSVSNRISVVADAYASKHFHAIRYVRWSGVNWTVPSVDNQRPRLILSLGEVYNGPTAE